MGLVRLIFLLAMFSVSSASAATLNVVGGQLFGASGVDVGGTLYNVEFLDGTCIALYDGCDDVSDFTFQTQADAVLASQALLDQVFLDGADLFDSDPALTNGCEFISECRAVTPYGLPIPTIRIGHQAVNNILPGGDFEIGVSSNQTTLDLTDQVGNVYAVWSSVPEPSTAILLGMGLAGLGWRGRPKQS